MNMNGWTALEGQDAYSGSFQIPSPKGVYQAEGDTNVNAEYAYRAENMRTERGRLASAYGTRRAFPSVGVPVATSAVCAAPAVSWGSTVTPAPAFTRVSFSISVIPFFSLPSCLCLLDERST